MSLQITIHVQIIRIVLIVINKQSKVVNLDDSNIAFGQNLWSLDTWYDTASIRRYGKIL